MKFRNLIFILTIAFSAIFVVMIGSSYAYYAATDGITVDVQTSDIDPNLAVIFEETRYINIKTAIPVNGYSSAFRHGFMITLSDEILNDDDTEFVINIGISDIYIDESLRVDDFKYWLRCDELLDSGWLATVINPEGTGTKFTDNVIESGYLLLGSINSNDMREYADCSLHIWLQETGEDQNHLMNKKFSGIIKVDALFRK